MRQRALNSTPGNLPSCLPISSRLSAARSAACTPDISSATSLRQRVQFVWRNFEHQFVVDLQQHLAPPASRGATGDGSWIIASLIRSAAEPWMTVLIAVRSGRFRWRDVPRRMPLNRTSPAEDGTNITRSSGTLPVYWVRNSLHARIALEIGVDERAPLRPCRCPMPWPTRTDFGRKSRQN